MTQHHTSEDLTGLALRVREATAERHRSAESRGFVTALMGGELTLDHYIAYLAQYARIYRVLEDREPQPGDPTIAVDARLFRSASIESDLVALGAGSWRDMYPALPATEAYVARLREAHGSVPKLIAHQYTRYLGDLSGGQAIGALVARHYGATEDMLGFYRFDGIDSSVAYKRHYRAELDSLAFDDVQIDEFLREACIAFDLNAALFDELAEVQPVAVAAA